MEDEAKPEVNPKSPASMVDVVPAASYNESPPPPPGVDFFESGEGLKEMKFEMKFLIMFYFIGFCYGLLIILAFYFNAELVLHNVLDPNEI
jgi:hypothetical protein